MGKFARRLALIATMATAAGMMALPVVPADAAPTHPAAGDPFPRGERAIRALGDRLPTVAAAHGMKPGELKRLFRTDGTLAASIGTDGLAYFDELPPGEAPAAAEGDAGSEAGAPPVTDPVFQLESLPGSNFTIFLDFDGHTTQGTTWNNAYGQSTITSPPFNLGSDDPNSWSSTELSRIEATFQGVAEDFAPFDVNVTTKDPGSAALSKSGAGDTQWGTRVVITADTFANCGCGGHAYIGSFEDSADEPVFVYNTSLAGVREAASHEVGHALHLSHDGTSSVTYYRGHGSGAMSWAPIMGASYYESTTQWSDGSYYDANNTGSSANYNHGPDDLAIITAYNGFGYRPDDHGDHAASATPLLGTSVSASGLIERTSDVDAFSFSTTGGAVALDVTPTGVLPNLNVAIELRNSTGGLVASGNSSTSLGASLTANVGAGTYTLLVDGVGIGNPMSSSPTGFSDYGSLGEYDVAGTLPPDGPPDTDAPAAPTGLQATADGSDIVLDWDDNSEPDLSHYKVLRSASSGGPYTEIAQVGSSSHTDTGLADGTWHYVVRASDTSGNTSANSGGASATVTTPVGPDHTDGEQMSHGSQSGTHTATWSSGGATETLSESHYGGKPRDRHDGLEHTWTLPVTSGNRILDLEYSIGDAGDADHGFDLAWSGSASGPWTAIGALLPGTTAATFDLGAGLPGSIHLRITDTDRTGRQNANDSITVDMIELSGGTPPTDPPGPVSDPSPADGATGVSTGPLLTWTAASGATSYKVWFASTPDFSGTGPVTETSNQHDPGNLAAATTYYWRVDAVNSLGTTNGDVWSFTTAAGPTSMRVQSVDLGTSSASKGQKFGTATVTIVDNLGNPVVGAVVTGTFSGDFQGQSDTAVTDANGVAVLYSSTSVRKPSFGFCVSSVTGPLSWDGAGPCGAY